MNKRRKDILFRIEFYLIIVLIFDIISILTYFFFLTFIIKIEKANLTGTNLQITY